MCKVRFSITKILKKNTLLVCLCLISYSAYTQDSVTYTKLPQTVFLDLITKTKKFEVNHATEFKHVDLPKNYYNTFLSYIKDSVAKPIPDLKSLVYYTFTLTDGKVINGDIYWNGVSAFIIFKIEQKVYVNYFTQEGIAKLKTIFKL